MSLHPANTRKGKFHSGLCIFC